MSVKVKAPEDYEVVIETTYRRIIFSGAPKSQWCKVLIEDLGGPVRGTEITKFDVTVEDLSAAIAKIKFLADYEPKR